MKCTKILVCITPLALLIVGCAMPVQEDHTIAQWQREGMLPPTGYEGPRVYPERSDYPAQWINIVVEPSQRGSTDGVVADTIRRQFEYDRGVAPSLKHMVISIQSGHITLMGTVKSDLDAQVAVDNIRRVAGVTRVTNNLEINPYVD
jgi:hypothetical protein